MNDSSSHTKKYHPEHKIIIMVYFPAAASYIVGLGKATIPEKFVFSQEELRDACLKQYDTLSEEKKQRFAKLSQGVKVKRRAVIPPHGHAKNLFHNVREKYPDLLENESRPIFEEYIRSACENCIQDWGGNKKDITHVSFGTDTNFQNALPSLIKSVIDKLGLSHDVHDNTSQNMGCCGGFQVLIDAMQKAKADPNYRILVVYADLTGTQHAARQLEVDDNDLLQFALFGDGAFAAMVAGSNCFVKPGQNDIMENKEKPILSFVSDLCRIVPNTKEILSHKNGKYFVYSVVERAVPEKVSGQVPDFIQTLKKRAGLDDKTIDDDIMYLVHPGGPKILEGFEKHYGLTPKDLRPSYTALEEHGNMSGCTNLAVLYYWKKESMEMKKKKFIICISFGPGIKIQGILFRNTKAKSEGLSL